MEEVVILDVILKWLWNEFLYAVSKHVAAASFRASEGQVQKDTLISFHLALFIPHPCRQKGWSKTTRQASLMFKDTKPELQ